MEIKPLTTILHGAERELVRSKIKERPLTKRTNHTQTAGKNRNPRKQNKHTGVCTLTPSRITKLNDCQKSKLNPFSSR
jgi:hypothetical protein